MGDMSMPSDYPTIPVGVYDEVKLVKLARQIAMGIKSVPDILYDNGLTQREFHEISQLPLFTRMLSAEMKAWEAADNTHGRLRLKTAAMLEEYLPELYARLNDREEPLMAKMKAIEVAAKIASVGSFGEKDVQPGGNPGDKVQVIINLGGDAKVEYVKQLPRKVIDVTPEPVPAPVPAPMSFDESLDASANQV